MPQDEPARRSLEQLAAPIRGGGRHRGPSVVHLIHEARQGGQDPGDLEAPLCPGLLQSSLVCVAGLGRGGRRPAPLRGRQGGADAVDATAQQMHRPQRHRPDLPAALWSRSPVTQC